MLLFFSLETLRLQEGGSLKKVTGLNEAKVEAVQEVHEILHELCSGMVVAEAHVSGDPGASPRRFQSLPTSDC